MERCQRKSLHCTIREIRVVECMCVECVWRVKHNQTWSKFKEKRREHISFLKYMVRSSSISRPWYQLILEIYISEEWKDEWIVWHETLEACQWWEMRPPSGLLRTLNHLAISLKWNQDAPFPFGIRFSELVYTYWGWIIFLMTLLNHTQLIMGSLVLCCVWDGDYHCLTTSSVRP